jgi:hypothetical protein
LRGIIKNGQSSQGKLESLTGGAIWAVKRIGSAGFTDETICTVMHRNAQSWEQNLIDGEKRKDYLAPQIEPKSLRTLRLGFEGAAKRNSGCAANLNCKARSLCGAVWKARQV